MNNCTFKGLNQTKAPSPKNGGEPNALNSNFQFWLQVRTFTRLLEVASASSTWLTTPNNICVITPVR